MGIAKNLEDTRVRIARAAAKSGRSEADITLVAVTKTVGEDRIREALACGVRELGENKVQEMVVKAALLSGSEEKPAWHMIGRLQTNKAKAAAETAALIHSVDSLRLAQEISRRAQSQVSILMQVNVANETTKAGIDVESAKAFARDLHSLPNLRLRGLMTIAPAVENPEGNRIVFRKLNKLFVDIRDGLIDNDIKYLSMGMTSDFEVAIEEGSNMVRIGTGIFGER
ncbi:MAG: YggS family pyridoxal phosphate-dependent enzyme [Defluviitaleaceae bacterium]|nr:YggS family pyridoxal phosphate-dependent enzyme [Defluviitaleaceae bacterium]